MISRNWLRRSARACGIISLLAGAGWGQSTESPVQTAAPGPAAKVPAVALVDNGDQAQWQTWTASLGWRVITPVFPEGTPEHPNIDVRVQALAAAVSRAIQSGAVDPARVYIAGRGDAAAAVFYTISRVPDLWAAGLALGGSPMAAINSGRIFAVNFTNTPVLWISSTATDQAMAARLKSDGLNVEWRSAEGLTNAAIFEWLTKLERSAFPTEIDCETNSPTFAHCYWIEMDKFDTGERNDVLPGTFLKPENPATLDLGNFSYSRDDPGPGLLLSLPEKYSGPLKKGDRLMAIDGKAVDNAQAYAAMMAKASDKQVAVMVQRGKERVRVETRIMVPRIEVPVTARVQAQYVASDNDIQIVSRTVSELRVTIPPQWALGSRLYWNGLSLENIATPGCLKLVVEKELLHAAKCQ
jgi:predicted esterase